MEEAGTAGWVKRLRGRPAPLRARSQRWGSPGCALPQWALGGRAAGSRRKERGHSETMLGHRGLDWAHGGGGGRDLEKGQRI